MMGNRKKIKKNRGPQLFLAQTPGSSMHARYANKRRQKIACTFFSAKAILKQNLQELFDHLRRSTSKDGGICSKSKCA